MATARSRVAWERRYYQATTSLFEEVCREHNLTVFTLAADRHGSIVWEAGEVHDGDRYVTAAITPLDDVPDQSAPTYSVEVWAAAANERSYNRQLVARYDPTGLSTFTFARTLRSALTEAVKQARELAPDEDTEEQRSWNAVGDSSKHALRSVRSTP
jgi:hypothetical protein